jgi:choice-of-anchor C domain-containing protein
MALLVPYCVVVWGLGGAPSWADATTFVLNGYVLNPTLGPDETIVIETGQLTRACDFFQTISDIYVVPRNSAVDGAGLPAATLTTVESFLLGSLFYFEIIGTTAPSGAIASGPWDVVEDACQNGVFDAGLDSVLTPGFSVAPVANHLANASFEDGTDPGPAGLLNYTSASSPGIPGWVVSDDDVDVMGLWMNPSDGSRSIDLNGVEPGALAQSFATVPGAVYSVTFDMAGNPVGLSNGTAILEISAAGQSAQFQTAVGDGSNPPSPYFYRADWVRHSWSFTATAFQTTLEFRSLNLSSGAGGPAIDNAIVRGPLHVPGLGVPGLLVLTAGLLLCGASVLRGSARIRGPGRR